MTSQAGQRIIAIHIVFNVSISKGNQAMKLGQLIEYNMRNTFLETSYTKRGGYFIILKGLPISNFLRRESKLLN